MTENEILNSLKKKEYAPVYFLQGEEPFYIDQISNFIEENAIAEAEKGFNQTIMYGKDSSMVQILGNAKRFPMMADKQLVIVKEAQYLLDFKNEEGRDMLEAYCKNPVPSTILVFCHKYGSLNGTTKLAKTLKKQSVLLTTKALRDYQMPGWIKSYLDSNGIKATEKAIQLLADHLGTNLERLTNEINKLLINVDKGTVIDDTHIDKYVGINKDYNVFELQKAIIFKDVVKANRIVKYFGANPKEHHPIPIIALLYGFFTRVLKAHTAADKSQKGLSTYLKVSPFAVKDYVSAARNYSVGKVLQNIGFLHKADLVVKGVESSQIKEGIILKQLVFELLH
jgi:DNA polymerase III subunit delta